MTSKVNIVLGHCKVNFDVFGGSIRWRTAGGRQLEWETAAVMFPAAASVEALTPGGASPVIVKSAARNLDVKVMADITATVASSKDVAGTVHGPEVSSQKVKG